MSHLRWIVEIDYRSEKGLVIVDHHIEELDELADLVERGPDWNSIEYPIRIRLNPEVGEPTTIEEAERS